jgi:predicted PhzF superfamily epimerase YddE/YHI9
MNRPFYIVDVFAERPCTGNPLAVVLDADELGESAMQALAAETNYSETAFVATDRDPDGAFRVRLFTPAREIGFAGHPILGTGWVVRHHLLSSSSDHVWLRIAIGDVSVTFEPPPAAETSPGSGRRRCRLDTRSAVKRSRPRSGCHRRTSLRNLPSGKCRREHRRSSSPLPVSLR